MGDVTDIDDHKPKPLLTLEDPVEYIPGDAAQVQLNWDELSEEDRRRLRNILVNIEVRLYSHERDCVKQTAAERAKERWFKGGSDA